MSSLHQRLQAALETKSSAGLRRELRVVPDDALDLASNDYLGFARHPAVVEAAREAVAQCGTGARASRLVSGNLALHEQLESALASFKNCESALLFPSGYMANLAVITALAQRGDLIFCDKRNHASLIDGCRLASASGTTVRFYGDLEKLRALLENARDGTQKFIVSDAVYSMDGDLADVPALLKLAKEFDATLILDDAHGTGTMGKYGRGTLDHFRLMRTRTISPLPDGETERDIFAGQERVIQTGTLSKALGSQGGFVVGSQVVIDYLINTARPFIYTTALSPPSCYTALCALNLLETQPQHLARLREVKTRLARGLRELGFDVRENASPILPVIVGEARDAIALSENLLQNGVWCPAIRPPTVRAGQSRLRITASAALSDNDVARALKAFEAAKNYPPTSGHSE